MILLALAAAASVGPARPITPKEKAVITEAVKAELLDPESANFKFVPVNGKTWKYCATVNSKNRMGGYGGFRTFSATVERDATDKITSVVNVKFIEPDDYSPIASMSKKICENFGYAVM